MFKPFTLNIRGQILRVERPLVMSIINITPDSFYSDSRSTSADQVKKMAEEAISAGADIIDVGAYSTRPGADEVNIEEEKSRLFMGLDAIRQVSDSIPISVDTFRAEVAREAVTDHSADIINDISGGDLDSEMFDTVASLRVPYILMHTRGTPRDMQKDTEYVDVTAEVIADLSRKLRTLRLLGVSDVIVDPGFGFAKTLEQNYALLRNLEAFTTELDAPLLVGVSRKSMITKLLDITPTEALNGTTVINTLALTRRAAILRVHDTLEAVQAVKIYMSSI
ncbi:MAG: dihydropteroate synthase [Muribaculaceae bacterium]|nr:dihydropteroate synthase [Muribaculaceae bacterium]